MVQVVAVDREILTVLPQRLVVVVPSVVVVAVEPTVRPHVAAVVVVRWPT